MACGDCTEFLVQGSGMVGSGSALAYEKVINFFDSDNIPLTVRSAEVLTKNGSPLVDTTPSWFGFETSAQSLLIDGVITYRLTVTVQIDAVVAGEGTYNIRVCARVVDDSKAQICCSFNVCITAAAAVGPGQLVFHARRGGSEWGLWSVAVPAVGSPAATDAVNIRSYAAQFDLTGVAPYQGRLWFKENTGATDLLKSMEQDGLDETTEFDTGIVGTAFDSDLHLLDNQIVYFADRDYWRSTLPIVSPTLVVNHPFGCAGVSWQAGHSYFVFSDGNSTIRCNANTGAFEPLDSENSVGCAHDYIRDKVYLRQWVPAVSGNVKSANNNLSGKVTLISGGADWGGQSMLDYDPEQDYIFYAIQSAGSAMFYRIKPDGTLNELVFDGTVNGFVGLSTGCIIPESEIT